MGKTLLADQFSFQARTLRVYVEPSGQPLHVGHTIKVVLRRPDRLMISVVGDDGSTKLFYDGKTAILLGAETNKYVTVPVPNTIQGMLETVMGKLGVDFPLADFLTDNNSAEGGRDHGIAIECAELIGERPTNLGGDVRVLQEQGALKILAAVQPGA
jgi:hypothetical protein